MGRIVLKTDPGLDRYVIWSSVVDDIVAGPGTRAQVLHYLTTEATPRPYTPHQAQALLDRVDRVGSSDRSPVRFGFWDDDPLPAGLRDGWWCELPRDHLDDYVTAVDRGDDHQVRDLLVRTVRYGHEPG